MEPNQEDLLSAVLLIQIKARLGWLSSLLAASNLQKACAMREYQPKYIDTITLIALVLMLFSGAMALHRYLTAEQPGLAPDVQFATVRHS
jgi:hypothetical protein